jgi:Domain of unknown function (DUF4190)/GYF domain 2
MQIYILRDNQQTGPFTEAEVRAELAAGTITPDSLVWWDGLPEWKALSQTPIGTAPAAATVVTPAAVVPPPAATFVPGATKTSGLAIVSLVLGIPGFLCAPILGLAAVVLGHIARSQIRKDPTLKGSGMALIGLIFGYLWLLLFVGWIAFSLSAAGKNFQAQLQKAIQEQQAKQLQNANTNNAPATPPSQ